MDEGDAVRHSGQGAGDAGIASFVDRPTRRRITDRTVLGHFGADHATSALFPRVGSAASMSFANVHAFEGPAPKGLLARRRMTILAQTTPTSASNGLDLPVGRMANQSVAFADDETNDMQLALPTLDLPMRPYDETLLPGARHSPADGQPVLQKDLSFVASKSFIAKSGKLAGRRVQTEKHPHENPLSIRDRLPHWKQWCLKAMNHRCYYAFLCITTLYIIFEDDVKRAALPDTWDLPLETMIAFILVTIMIEMGLSSFIKPGYLLGFYFWVDCIVCASLFFEVPSVKKTVLGIGDAAISIDDKDNFIAWAGNRAFISSKVARVARIFRLLRLLRLYSVFRRFEARRRIRAALAKAGIRPGEGEERIAEEELSLIELEILQDQDKETRVGQKLEELIIRRIIIFVLVCVLFLPAFEAEYGLWGKYRGVDRGGLSMLHDMAITWGGPVPPGATADGRAALPASPFTTALMAFLQGVVFPIGAHDSSQVLELVISNATYVSYPEGMRRRYDELYYMDFKTYNMTDPACRELLAGSAADSPCTSWYTYALYDWKWYSQVAAILSISRSLFVITFLTLGAYLLNRDSRVLVLEPIERMLARVSALAENPLALQATAHAPWQEQLERMQQAQEQEAIMQAQQAQQTQQESLKDGDGLDRKKSLTDMLFTAVRKRSTVPETDVQAVISIGAGRANSQNNAAANGDSTHTLAWSEVTQVAGFANVEDSQRTWAAASSHGGASALSLSTYAARDASPGWRVLGSSVTAAVRLQTTAATTRWQRLHDHTRHLLRRLATNFWDGTDEEHGPLARQPAGAGGTKAGAVATAKPGKESASASYETQLLENSIQKIGALLAVGFGDAGAEIIAENIRNEGDINPMVPGRKTVAVFGFCDIRRFTDATEVLQEEVMEFVNSIARIVHTSVAIHGGAANKNIGDAFLLVWKLPKGFTMADLRDACEHNTTCLPGLPDTATAPNSTTVYQHRPASERLSLQSCSNEQHSYTIPARPIAEAAEEEGVTYVEPMPASLPEDEPVLALPLLTPGAQDWPRLGAEDSFMPQSFTQESSVASEQRLMQQSATRQVQVSSMHPPSPFLQQDVPLPGLTSGHNQSYALPSPPKPRFMSIQDNRVVPLTLSEALPSSIAGPTKSRAFSRGVTGATFATIESKKEFGANDLEFEAVRRVIRMRSKGGEKDGSTAVSVPEKGALVAAVADNALTSFIIVHAALKRSVRLARYARRTDLAARLGPNFRVQMGFGLHVGWAIEGAIGSEYKIDASYLSPNVNMASRLEAATKQFGVSLLMSEDFADCLSVEVRARVRQIDCVTVKGSAQPMGLFTYDIDLDGIREPDPDMPGAEEEEEAFWANYACGLCATDDVAATWGVTMDFMQAFELGFQAYKSGDWRTARARLTAASDMRRNMHGHPMPDPPSQVLLTYMEQHNFHAPESWRGFRELTEK